jgi:predicted SAM-dependent methyltransferase
MRVLEIGGQPKPKAHIYFRGAEIFHLDANPLHEPDFLIDAQLVTPEDTGTFDGIMASHVLEHFHWIHVRGVLERWKALLNPGGEIHIIVPDLGWVCDNLHELPWHVQPHLFGGHINEWDVHKVMFTEPMLAKLAQDVGFLPLELGTQWYEFYSINRPMKAKEIYYRGIIDIGG